MNKKYAVHPGFVMSQNDGQEHFINGPRLADLYQLKPGEYIIWDDSDPARTKGLLWDDFHHLFPDYYGRYGRPDISERPR